MIAAIPFRRSRIAGVVDTTLAKTRSLGPTVRKLKTYYEIPAFAVANIWRGASEIIIRFKMPSGLLNLLNKFPLTPPDNVNFCPVIAWREDGEQEFRRYKLWKDVGEILWLPLYNKEKVNASYFFIEIWNTDTRNELILGSGGDAIGADDTGLFLGYSDPVNLLLAAAIKLYTSRLVVPSDFCNDYDILLGSATQCNDPIFDLTDFRPVFGDYYIFDGDCARLLIHGDYYDPAATYNILKSSDDTWHYVWMATNDGVITYRIDQDNAVPPADALGYFPMRPLGAPDRIFKLALHTVESSNHTLSIIEEMSADTPNAYNLVKLTNQDDALKYGLYLRMVGAYPQFSVYPVAI